MPATGSLEWLKFWFQARFCTGLAVTFCVGTFSFPLLEFHNKYRIFQSPIWKCVLWDLDMFSLTQASCMWEEEPVLTLFLTQTSWRCWILKELPWCLFCSTILIPSIFSVSFAIQVISGTARKKRFLEMSCRVIPSRPFNFEFWCSSTQSTEWHYTSIDHPFPFHQTFPNVWICSLWRLHFRNAQSNHPCIRLL